MSVTSYYKIVSVIKMSNYCKITDYLFINYDVLKDITAFANISNKLKLELEFSVFCLGKTIDNKMYVEKCFFPDQENSGTNTVLTDKGNDQYSEWFLDNILEDNDLRFIGWFHSHTTRMSCFMSYQDKECIENYQKDFAHDKKNPLVHIVFSFAKTKFDKLNVRIDFLPYFSDFTKISGERVVVESQTQYYCNINQITGNDLVKFEEIWKQNCKYKIYTPPVTNWKTAYSNKQKKEDKNKLTKQDYYSKNNNFGYEFYSEFPADLKDYYDKYGYSVDSAEVFTLLNAIFTNVSDELLLINIVSAFADYITGEITTQEFIRALELEVSFMKEKLGLD